MALISPGVQVTVIDESQYIPSAVNTVPYFVIATAQNKVSGSGTGVAAGTIVANANKTYLITSQRDLTATFGVPFFYSTTTGTPINGYELNEYGLLAAYSALGISNRAYVQRVNVDLTQLTATLTRPVGAPADGTFWLDTSASVWGIQQWNAATGTFTVKTPIVITSTTQVVDAAGGIFTPLASVGNIGDYAIVSTNQANDIFNVGWYKNNQNSWVVLGSDEWKLSWPTVQGTAAPTSLTTGANMYINGVLVAVGAGGTALTVAGYAQAINAQNIPGVIVNSTSGKLTFFANSLATDDLSSQLGVVNIELGTVGGAALLTALGLVVQVNNSPIYIASFSFQAPRWGSTQFQPRPTGSIWNNVSPVNNGLNLKIKKYSAALGAFVLQNTPAFFDTNAAIFGLDPVGGGKNIPVGATFVQFDANAWLTTPNQSASFEIFEKVTIGQTVVTGSNVPTTFTASTFNLIASVAGTNSGTPLTTVTIPASATVAQFISAISAAQASWPQQGLVTCAVNSAGNLVFTHIQGGVIGLTQLTGNALSTAGFSSATPLVRVNSLNGTTLVLSNFVTAPEFTYTSSSTAPDQNPATGRLWYYSVVDQVDVMIQNGGSWVGYQTVENDVRGYDLTLTNSSGPIVAATAPVTQTDIAKSPLEYGDIWIDSADLENYPMMYRWQPVTGVDQWVSIDTTDQVTQNGVLFADARWAPNNSTDPVTDPVPTIASLLTSSYLDPDAPSASTSPQGMLLWNTRRSGYNVKSFQSNYFNPTDYPTFNGTATSCWLTASGNKANGAMYAGRQAQREMIVKAMKSGIDTSVGAREDTAQYTLIASPAYPELIPNMIALGNERNNTLFVVGDTPLRLAGTGNDLVAWATNNNGLGLPAGDGQVATSNYCATFYPSCTTTDLGGSTVVQPSSHMMMRTIIRSDEVSYPWLAPAGTRRGVVDNAIQLGYIDGTTGEFTPLGVNQALRDTLYINNVNPITFIPGVGITNFGNKTSTTTTTALDRINVARLVAFLRGRLEEIGKLYLFEPNDQITRNQITNTCNSLMIDLIAKRAIYDYLVVCDLSNNTPARIDRNELWVDIAIEPVKAVEFIYIPLRIKNTGAITAGA